MEEFVSKLLENADLTILTKKHVRVQYKQNVGRDLTVEEKSRISDLVYEFVRDVAERQKRITCILLGRPLPALDSHGNKENEQSNKLSSKLVNKGCVEKTDKYNTYAKRSNKQKNSKTNQQNNNLKRQLKLSPKKTRSEPAKKNKVSSAKVKADKVVSAVLDDVSDDLSSIDSDSISSVTSLESEIETMNELDIKKALEKLGKARDKKIQMAIEKKKSPGNENDKRKNKGIMKLSDNSSLLKEITKEVDVKSLNLLVPPSDGDKSKEHLKDGSDDKSELIGIVGAQSMSEPRKCGFEGEKLEERLKDGSGNKLELIGIVGSQLMSEPGKCGIEGEKLEEQLQDDNGNKTELMEIDDTQTPSGPGICSLDSKSESLPKTPEITQQNSPVSSVENDAAVKKRRKRDACFETDSESENEGKLKEIQFLPRTRRIQRDYRELAGIKKVVRLVDSDDEPLSKVSAKLASIHTKDLNAKEDRVSLNSDMDIVATPVAKQRLEMRESNDSAGNARDIKPMNKTLSKGCQLISNIWSELPDSDSDTNTGNEPLVKKRQKKIKKHNFRQKCSSKLKCNSSSSDSEDSSCDVPLIKMRNQNKKQNITCHDSNDVHRLDTERLDSELDSSLLKSLKKKCNHKDLRKSDVTKTYSVEGESFKNKQNIIVKANSVKSTKRKKDSSSDSDNDVLNKTTDKAKRCMINTGKEAEHKAALDKLVVSKFSLSKSERVSLPSVNCDITDKDMLLTTVSSKNGKSRKSESCSEGSKSYDVRLVNGISKVPMETRDVSLSGDSDTSEDLPLSKLGNVQTDSHGKKQSKVVESHQLNEIMKICEANGLYIQKDKEFNSCTSDEHKVKRVKKLLRQAGTNGDGKRETSGQSIDDRYKLLSSKNVKNPFSGLAGVVDSNCSDND